MLKTEKVLLLKNYKGKSIRVVREHYLREDVPCYSALCQAGCFNDGKLLPDDLTHYVVPDWRVVLDFLEILEFVDLRGNIITQTACQAVQHKRGNRQYNKLRNLFKDAHHDCIQFCNEFQRYSYCPREKGESMDKWQSRCVYSAAVWYYHHLVCQMPVVMVTEDEDVIEKYKNETQGVFVISFKEYLEDFCPDLKAAHELYDSIIHSLRLRDAESKEALGKEYPEHLPVDVLLAGIKSGRYMQGILNVNKHRAQAEAFVRLEGATTKELSSDILIHGMKFRNRAVHGDVVIVELLPESDWKGRITGLCDNESDDKAASEILSEPMPTGRIVGILQRKWRDYVASFPPKEERQFQDKNSRRILVTPWDYRIPRIRISTHQAEALQDYRIVVHIDAWESTSTYPNGHLVKVLGKTGDLETEIQSLLVENSISVALFSDAQMREMPIISPEKPWTVRPEDEMERTDLRSTHLIFSIDPKGCEDVDDALSVKKLDNGNLELGVHIADVTHFVKARSLTDLEAQKRATTYYLADRCYSMLPSILSANLCSLLGSKDRFTVSVMWELDEDYEVKKVWYGRTIIRSAYKLCYEAAQALLNGDTNNVDEVIELQELDDNTKQQKLNDLMESLHTLTDVAHHIRAKRNLSGALELEGVEVKVQLGDDKSIDDLVPRQPLEVHETIAECMIMANHWVAKKIWESHPHCALLRCHPPPRQELFSDLITCAKAKGFTIDTRSNKALADSLDKAVDPNDPVVNKLLRFMATQAMSNALYFSTGSCHEDEFYHYGLALDKYTHFTSPIRRYADIVVHRLLLSAILNDQNLNTEEHLNRSKDLEELCRHINSRNRSAQHVQKQSTELFQCMYFKERDPLTDEQCIADGVIYSIQANGVLVFIPRYGIKAAAYLKNREGLVISVQPDGKCEWEPGSLQRYEDSIASTTAGGSSATFSLFAHVTVQISVQTSRYHADIIRLEIISNRPYESLESDNSQEGSPNTEAELVREVTRSAEDAQLAQEEANVTTFQDEVQEYRQTQGRSLYTFFEEIRELALLDVSAG